MSLDVKTLDAENGPLIGISLAAIAKADDTTAGVIKVGEEEIKVPLRFYKGSLELVRTELHNIIDELIDTLSSG